MEKIKGIIPPMITPLLDNNTVDYEGARKIADNMIGSGVSAIFLLGTTGEAQSIAMHLRYEFVENMCRYINGRVPVLVAVSETSMEDSLNLAAHAKKCGANAVVAAAPYYFPANQMELIDWFTFLADHSPLPVYLYNMPSKVKVSINTETVKYLSAHPNIIGIKDSSGNLDYFRELISLFKNSDFAIYMGPEELTAQMVFDGADGGVNGGANLYPELFVEMFKAAEAKDAERTRILQDKIMYLSDNLYCIAKDSDASFLKGIKSALSVKGVCSGYVAYPYKAFKNEELEIVREIVNNLESRNYR